MAEETVLATEVPTKEGRIYTLQPYPHKSVSKHCCGRVRMAISLSLLYLLEGLNRFHGANLVLNSAVDQGGGSVVVDSVAPIVCRILVFGRCFVMHYLVFFLVL